MPPRRIAGHAPMEPVFGYSRAVVDGDHVWVSGTAPIPADGSDPPSGSYAQACLCLEIVGAALAEAGASLTDVVRTRIFATPDADWDEIGRAHGETFAEIRPATSAVTVHALIDERWLVEIEAVASIG